MMRNINEALLEVEDIINYNMETLHKLAEIANTIAKDNISEQEALAKSIACLWLYLKPVHKWIREQNQPQIKFYDELDKYLENQSKLALEAKSLAVSKESVKKSKGKK